MADGTTQWATSSHSTRKLGILAGTFEDGSLSIFVVPDPEDLAQEDEGLPVCGEFVIPMWSVSAHSVS